MGRGEKVIRGFLIISRESNFSGEGVKEDFLGGWKAGENKGGGELINLPMAWPKENRGGVKVMWRWFSND